MCVWTSIAAQLLILRLSFAEEEDDEEEKVGPTIRYLQNLGAEDVELILQTSHWVLEANARLGMEVSPSCSLDRGGR